MGFAPPPSPLVFVFFWGGGRRGVSCRGFVVSVAGCPGLGSRDVCPPFPSRSGGAFVCFLFLFFFRPSVVCVGVFGVFVLPVGRCSRFGVASFGWVVLRCPFGGSHPRCILAGGFGRFLWPGWAVSWLLAFLVPPPPCFFFGGVCLFLPLPSLGWCTHWSAFGVVFRVAVGVCVLPDLAPAPWVGWVMFTLGSAALPAGFGPGSATCAVAPGGFVRLCVRGGGVFRVPSPPRCPF